jgi:glutathione S-transferase
MQRDDPPAAFCRGSSTMDLELFVFPASPRAFKVMAVANHLGLDYVQRFVDLRCGENRQPEYAALNPNMRMPTLKHGDYVLWESNAIMQYLALLWPAAGLLPADERGRLDVTRWQFWDLAHMDTACAPYMWEYPVKRMMGIPGPDLDAVARAEAPFHRSAGVLNAQLRGRTYVTGETLTLADFALGANLIHAGDAHMPLEPYAEIRRWYENLCALPGWQRTLQGAAMPAAKAA